MGLERKAGKEGRGGRKREEGEGWGVRNNTGYNGKSRYIIST